MNIVIKKFNESDWQLYKEIRLQALRSDPEVFGSTFEKESATEESHWRSGLNNPDVAIFGIFDDTQIIGMTGVAIDRNDLHKKTAILWGSWLNKNYRRQRISEEMYRVRIDWAKEHATCEKILVSHRASNLASKNSNQKHGFIFTHTQDKEWPDGTMDQELVYELNLK